MDWLKFATVGIFLLASAFCLADEPSPPGASTEPDLKTASEENIQQSEQEKPKVMREVAQYWIQVGITQTKRGLYERAEESFLTARGYQEYLTAEEYKQLDELLDGAHKGAIEKQAALDHIKTAKDLLSQNQPIKARAHYEKVRNSPYLTEQQRRQIAQEIKKVDVNFARQTKEITELYNRSVALFNAGRLEDARKGFVEVAGYGLFIAPEGQSAEDYLLRIDNILIERLKYESSAKGETSQNSGSAESAPAPEIPVAALPIERQEQSKQQTQSVQEQAAEVTEIAEPTPAQSEPAVETRANIIRTYTKAVVEDVEGKVENYVRRGELDKALAEVRTATAIVKENRPFIGEESFTQYTIRLKQLADRIIEARKTS